jgi:DNA-binding IclR family transcriptional regulator
MNEPTPLIQSVDRAIHLLDIVAKMGENGISLKELSQQLELNASTLHHLVTTLTHNRILEQDPASKRYRLGIHLVELGQAAIKNTSLARVAQPYLEQIYAATGKSVSFLAFHGLLRTQLIDVRSQQIITAKSTPLDIFTLHATGSGKLLLAYLPEPEINSFLQSQRLERFTHNTLSDPQRLLAELARIREQGVSYDMEEYGNGVSCISAPVHDASKRVVGCIDMVFPMMEMDDQAMHSLAKIICKATFDLSAQLENMGLIVS